MFVFFGHIPLALGTIPEIGILVQILINYQSLGNSNNNGKQHGLSNPNAHTYNPKQETLEAAA